MFYEVGVVDKYSFVYDSDDGSCELVERTKLNGVDMQVGFPEKFNFNKLLYSACMQSFYCVFLIIWRILFTQIQILMI